VKAYALQQCAGAMHKLMVAVVAGSSAHTRNKIGCRASMEDKVLELYHNVNSVCAQKVRIALKEKGQEAQEHLLTHARRPERA